MTIDDETLMAFADGLLDEPAFSEVASAIENDPVLAARLGDLVVGREAARAAYAPLLDRGVPPRLRRAVDRAIAEAEPSARSGRSFGGWSIAAVAAVAVLIAAPAGYLLRTDTSQPGDIEVGGAINPALAALIRQTPSGARADLTRDTEFVAVATFLDGSGTLCREVELLGPNASVSVVCQAGSGWSVRIAVAIPAGAGGYLPATGLAAIEAYLGVIDAGAPLNADAERSALPDLAR